MSSFALSSPGPRPHKVRLRLRFCLVFLVTLLVGGPLAGTLGAQEAPSSTPATPSGLTPQQQEQMQSVREASIAAARRALADPEFVAAVHRMSLSTSGESTGQNRVAVPLQLAAGMLYTFGTGKIREAIFEQAGVDYRFFPPKVRRFTPAKAADLNPARKLAIGVAAIGASAAMAYLSPPVAVEEGFRDMSFEDRLSSVQDHAWQLPGPPLVEKDVDDPTDPGSCFATLSIRLGNGGAVLNFGEFTEEELAWTYPFGSYPGLGEVVPRLVELLSEVLGSFPGLDVEDMIAEIAVAGEFSVGASLTNFIDDLISSALDVEGFFYDSFTGWTFEEDRLACNPGPCRAPDGPSFPGFRATVSAVPGLVGYNFSYRQSLSVKEYFDPVFTGLAQPLTVYYEALEPGGVPTSLPPVGFDGAPAPGHSQVLDPTWFGLVDNCDPRPNLEWTLPAFLPLGTHTLTVRATDRSGNVAEESFQVIVRDSLPPDILPPEDVGITAPAGLPVILFNAPGVGCTTWLCEGNPPQYKLFPPVSFDFGSLEPVIACTLTNSLYATPKSCDDVDAQLVVGEDNTVTWTLTDPSGNSSTVTQLAVVRAEGTNRPPTVQSGAFTIAADVPVDLPLSASDPDVDPLTFVVRNLPDHGDLGLTAEAIFQTRFATSGVIRRATSFFKLENVPGYVSDLLIVADGPGHRLLVFNIENPDYPYLYDMIDLGDIAPDAIQIPGDPRTASGKSLTSVLNELWIADFTWDGDADTSVNTIWRNANNPQRMADLGPWVAAGAVGRDFRIDSWILQPGIRNQNADLTVFLTGDPPLLPTSPPSPSPLNHQLGFRLTSSDYGATWMLAVTDPGSPASATSTIYSSNGAHGCLGPFEAFWSLDPPVGNLREVHPLDPFLADPDGDGPALPVLQDPTSLGLSTCNGSAGTALILESQNAWLDAFEYDGTLGSIPIQVSNQCDPSNPPPYTVCRPNSPYPLRLTRFVNIRGIEELPGTGGQPLFAILDDSGLYRFDLAGRLDAYVSFLSGANDSMPPSPGHSWTDIATDPAGNIFLLSNPNSGTPDLPYVTRISLFPGVGQVFDDGKQGILGMNTGDRAWAVAADGTYVFGLGEAGLFRWTNDLTGDTQLMTTAPYRDVEIRTGMGEIFLSEVNGATQRIVRTDLNGNFIAAFGQGLFDFGPGASGSDLSDVTSGRMAYDAGADRLYVSDSYLSDPSDPGSPRIPRVRVFSGDGTLLETIVPDASPNIFASWLEPGDFGSVSDLAVGPGRIYVAEIEPLKRLHVFDATTAYPVPCDDPNDECRTVHYIPDPGYTGTDGFSYTATDVFEATSDPAGTLSLVLIDDTLPPVIDCPADLSVEARNPGGITLTEPLEREPDADLRAFFSPAVTDNVDLPEPTLVHDGGNSYPVGSTVVTFTATDGAGNVGSCQATLTVTDTTPPVFLDPDGAPLPGPVPQLPLVTIEAEGMETPHAPTPPAVSDMGGLTGLGHDGPPAFPLGDTTIVWTATDVGGNTATARQVIRVVDTTPPEFITPLPPDDLYTQVAVSGWANPAVYDPQEATDLVGVADLECSPSIGAPVPIGVNTIDCIATDTSGNVARRTFFVSVEDTDTDGDGLSDLVDGAPRLPSTAFATRGETVETAGTVLGGGHLLLVTEGPRQDSGVSVVVGGRNSPEPSEVAVCDGRLHAWLKFTSFEVNPGEFEEANDAAILTCRGAGLEAESELGTFEVSYALPEDALARAVLHTGEAGVLEGWLFTVPPESSGPVVVAAGEDKALVEPGQTVNLVEMVMGPSADLALSGKSTPLQAEAGRKFTVVFTVANRGPSAVDEGAELRMTAPEGMATPPTTQGCLNDPAGFPTCVLGPLAPGSTRAVQLTLRASQDGTTSLVVGGTVTHPLYDPVPGNNTATVVVPVLSSLRPAELSVGFSPEEIPALDGVSTLTVTLHNPDDGTGASAAAAFRVDLPAGLLVDGGPVVRETCGGTVTAVPGTPTVALAGAVLEPGAACTVSVDVGVDPDTVTAGPAVTLAAPATASEEPVVPAEGTLTLLPVTTFTGPTATGNGEATASLSGGGPDCTFTRIAWSVPEDIPPGPGLADGVLRFSASGCTPGATLELAVRGSRPAGEAARYWTWSSPGDGASPRWLELPAEIREGTVVVTVTDGGTGDGDALPDGRIQHAGGISPAPTADIPVLGPLGILLLLLLLGVSGAFLLGFRP